MTPEKKLGRGLASLLSEAPTRAGEEIQYLDAAAIVPSPLQPRKVFDPAALERLVESINENGLLQPVVVRRVGEKYELIVGERRWRAAQQLGLDKLPAIVREATDEKMLELALVENLQREDLNPIEKGQAFKDLISKFNLTQEQAAQRIGHERSSIANFIRLLDLPQDIQDVVAKGGISMGHARALLAVKDEKRQRELCALIQSTGMPVRRIEQEVYEEEKGAKKKRKRPKSAHIRDLERQLEKSVRTKVAIEDKGGKGRIIIEYYTSDDFERIMKTMGLKM